VIVMTVAAGIWLPLAAPLVGAALLVMPLTARAGRRWWDPITFVTLLITAVGLGCAVASWPVVGQAATYPVSLGPLDPSEALAGIAWSLAPVGLGGIFLVVGVRARSRLLVGAASIQLAIASLATILELVAPASESAGPGALVVDPLAVTLLAVSVLVGGLITVYALGYEPAHLDGHGLSPLHTPVFVAWLLVFISAMDLLVLADDLRLLVVAWEVTTLCSFALIGFDGDRIAVLAARRALAYNLLGGIALGTTALLAGPGGRVSDLIAGDVAAGWALPLALAGCIVAAATKSALAPFHPWLLGAMVAAAPVSALLHASAMVKAGSYLLLRLAPPITADGLLGPVLVALGGFSFAATAAEALRQRDLKRIFAYSTISTLGLIAVSAGLGSPAALAAGVLLLVFHAVAKALAFLSVGAIEQVTRTRDLEALVGAVRTMPRLAVPLVIAAVALALPPFGLVVAKWAILEIGAGDLPLIVLLAVGSAAYLAVWTAVIGRLIVRRSDVPAPAEPGGPLPRREREPIIALSLISAAGLVLAAPIARGLADPAGSVAFGINPSLATGWSIVLSGGSFVVPAIALLALVSAALALAVGRRIRRLSPSPYLSGAGLAHGPAGAFHGGRGGPVVARSGGFYWGGDVGTGASWRDAATPAPATPAPATPDAATPDAAKPDVDRPEASGWMGGFGSLMVVVGWLLIAAVALAAVVGAVGAGPSP
jgi:ech hydrogenase subunit A